MNYKAWKIIQSSYNTFFNYLPYKLPLTFNVAVWDVTPALFLAVQVYVPLCLYPTELIVNIEVLVPKEAVVRPGSEDILSPFNAQESVNGSSPFRTIQTNCANSPSSTTSLPKVKGSKTGGSIIN